MHNCILHRPLSPLFLDQSEWNFGSMPHIKFYDHLLPFFTPKRHWRVCKPPGVKNLGNSWSKSIVLENKVAINFILGMEPKNQVIWTTRCRVMAKYTSIHFDIFRQKLVYYKVHQKQKLFRDGRISIGLLVAFVLTRSHLRNPLKKCSFQKMWYFEDLGFP